MLTVSDAFKAAILPGTTQMRRTACRVTLNVSEADVTYGTPTAENGEAGFSDVTEVVDNVSINTYRIATCEPNYWRLDGSTVFYPAVSINVGYASEEVCDADGLFSEMKADPVVVIPVSTFTTKGITLFFDVLSGDYPTEFDIDILNGATSVYHLAVTGNDAAYYVLDADINVALADCDTVKVSFHKMCKGYRRARLSEIFMGFQAVYGIGGLDDMVSLNTIKEIDPTCATLPHGEAVLKLSNVNGDFNLINPEGIAEDLQAGAEMIVEHGVHVSDGPIEYVKTGTYLFKDWKDAGGKMVNLNGVDTLGYYGEKPIVSIYGWLSSQGPRTYVYAMLVGSDVDVYYVSPGYQEFPASDSGWLCGKPAENVREFLRECAQWLCRVCVVDEDNKIQFVDISTASDSDINLDDCYGDPTIERATPPKYIETYYYNAAAGTTDETIVSYKETFTGTKSFAFDIGYEYGSQSLTLTGASSYSDMGENGGKYIIEDVVGTGAEVSITVTGRKHQINKQLYTLTNATGSGTITIDNTHIATAAKAAEVAAWTLANYNKLLKFGYTWRGNPALEMGDMATAETIHGDKDIIVTRQDLTFSAGALDGSLEGVG